MKKLFTSIISVIYFISFISCGGSSTSSFTEKKDNTDKNNPSSTDNIYNNDNSTNLSDNENNLNNSINNIESPISSLSGNTFLAIYLVGSDLESGNNAGTTDLLELVKGYETLTDSQREKIYIYVAFGGANKDGWRGIKYADINCIIKDSKDKEFGNDSCYEYVQNISTQNLKNMSHPQAFSHFIKKINSLSKNFNTKILIMWNHGGAYEGYGWDENWQADGKTLDNKKEDLSNNDRLTIYEIRDVFKNENFFFDIIGFDACLMANLEVASAIKDYGNYLIASEETEPNHGWDYEDVIKQLSNNMDKSNLEKAKLIVDSYVNNKNHEQGSGLTLSVIDLSKIDELKTSLDNINFNNLNLTQIVSAEKTSQKYGYSMDGDTLKEDYYTIDMVQFFEKAKLISISEKIKNLVLYTKNDGSIVSNGISMVSFSKIVDMIYNKNLTLKEEKILPMNYFAFLENIQKVVSSDKTEPNINSSTCEYNGQTGICLQVSDNTAIQDVGVYTLVPTQYGYSYLVSYDYLPKTSNNTYFLNKNEYINIVIFCNGNCSNPTNYTFAPIYFLQQTPLNDLLYISPAVALVPTNRGDIELDGYLIIKINPIKQDFSVYFSISPTSKVRLEIGKHIKALKFKYLVVDSQGNFSQETSQPLTFDNGFDIGVVPITNFGVFPILIVETTDVAENITIYPLQ